MRNRSENQRAGAASSKTHEREQAASQHLRRKPAMNRAPNKFILEPERYELRSNALHHFSLQRREFFKMMGAGIAIFSVAANAVASQKSGGRRGNRDQEQPKDISSWLHIRDDGMVTVFTGKVEVGQNT